MCELAKVISFPENEVVKVSRKKNGEGKDAKDPFRTKEELRAMDQYFSFNGEHRNRMCFTIGCGCSLRASDLLEFTWGYFFRDFNGERIWNTSIGLIEIKTGKFKKIHITESMKAAVELFLKKEYIKKEDLPLEEKMFISRKRDVNGNRQAITVGQWNDIIKKASSKQGLQGKFGSHSCRKTWGYLYYQKTKAIATLMEIFNHSKPTTTLAYIGINDETIQESYIVVGDILSDMF